MNKFEGHVQAPPYTPLTNELSSTGLYPPTTQQPASSSAAVTELTTISVNQIPNLVALPPVGPKSQRMQCYHCKCQISTSVTTKANMKSHAMCLALAPFCLLCCCLIPYCFDSCKSQHHYCPNCNTYLGTFSH